MKTIYKNDIFLEDIKKIIEETKNNRREPIIWVIEDDNIMIVHNNNTLYFDCGYWVAVRYMGRPGSEFKVWEIYKSIYSKNFEWEIICFERNLEKYKKSISARINELKKQYSNIEYLTVDFEKKQYSYKTTNISHGYCGKFDKLADCIPTLNRIDFNDNTDLTKTKSFQIAKKAFELNNN